MGFTYSAKNKKADPMSKLRKQEIKGTGAKQHAASPNFMQVAWGIAVPRFEISFMGTTIAWFHSAYLMDGYYRFNPACQKIEANFYGAAGINVGLLTISLYSKTWNLWKYNKPILKAGNCPE